MENTLCKLHPKPERVMLSYSHLQLWFPTPGCLSMGKENQLCSVKENVQRTAF